jgi:hypothetical protein
MATGIGRMVGRAALVGAMLLATSGVGGAQALDPASREALAAVTRMLQDPAARQAALAGQPGGAAAQQQLEVLTRSPALMEELYALAAEVFGDLARGTGGDVGKMGEALERGRTDPGGFAAMLSPATLDRLRALSVKITDQRR